MPRPREVRGRRTWSKLASRSEVVERGRRCPLGSTRMRLYAPADGWPSDGEAFELLEGEARVGGLKESWDRVKGKERGR